MPFAILFTTSYYYFLFFQSWCNSRLKRENSLSNLMFASSKWYRLRAVEWLWMLIGWPSSKPLPKNRTYDNDAYHPICSCPCVRSNIRVPQTADFSVSVKCILHWNLLQSKQIDILNRIPNGSRSNIIQLLRKRLNAEWTLWLLKHFALHHICIGSFSAERWEKMKSIFTDFVRV